MLTNEEVIEEMLTLAKQIAAAQKEGDQAGQSIKVKDSSLRNAGMVGGKVMTDQIEGGQEIQQASMIMYEASKPVTGTASRGAELFKRQVINQQKRKIKKVETGKKILGKFLDGKNYL